ncbi:hypothetical protein ABFU52_13185 [Xanthomonas campestris pv. campestris]|uniref:hypothetical protein n=1 Tax=Xanthomonas campestris TaxID=339 RepID=UPI002B3C7D8E|nr:hypothetical protein [Xanthomonas campestris pv. campestris]MEB1310040.1 hypothetical protein [Xanthomonas campestris pv. campestris]MEB1335224.1 hypothetical protein [Xanthomonas campestris pv. campestris]
MKTTQVKKNLTNFKLSLLGPHKTGEKWTVQGNGVKPVAFSSAKSAGNHFDLLAKKVLVYDLQLDQVVALALGATARKRERIRNWLLSGQGITSDDLKPIQGMNFAIQRNWRNQANTVCAGLRAPLGNNSLRSLMKKKAGRIPARIGSRAPNSANYIEHRKVRPKK